MDHKTMPVISLETDEYVLLESFLPAGKADTTVVSPFLLSEEQLYALRSQLIRKNRLLTDLKRQLHAAQRILAQLHCMTDPNVTATLHMHRHATDIPISLLNCAANALQELDSSSDRMSYLVKQLQSDRFPTEF